MRARACMCVSLQRQDLGIWLKAEAEGGDIYRTFVQFPEERTAAVDGMGAWHLLTVGAIKSAFQHSLSSSLCGTDTTE